MDISKGMGIQCHGVTTDLYHIDLERKILSGLYLGNHKVKQVDNREIGWRV